VLKKKRIRNRKKHWSLFILAPSNPTNEYQWLHVSPLQPTFMKNVIFFFEYFGRIEGCPASSVNKATGKALKL